MLIEIPDWCKIGAYVQWKAPHLTGVDWVREKIIAYGYNGFYHQAHDCPLYFTKFSELGKTIMLEEI